MRNTGRVTRAAVAAGLGVMMAWVPLAPAFAQTGANDVPVVGESANPEYTNQVGGESTGDTKLYVIGKQDDLATSEGSITQNVKVSIPVAIHYVADSQGNLVGPSDDVVKFVNHTRLGAVHVSKIAVQNSGDASIVMDGENLGNDQMSFFVQPVQGQSDETGSTFTRGTATEGNESDYVAIGEIDQLGNYASRDHDNAKDPTHKGDWNVAQGHGALALNGLTGRIGGFGKLDASTDYQAGTIHWTVRAGTRAQADQRDATLTIHYNSNDGTNAGCVPVADQKVQVLMVDQLPDIVPNEEELAKPLARGASDVVAPKSYTRADGTVVNYAFKEWNTQADGQGTTVAKVGDLGTAQSLAGAVMEVYAIFEEV